MLPCRFILINQQVFKGILGLETTPINNVLFLKVNIYQFKSVLTDAIIQSFETNSSNVNFIKILPIEIIASTELSLSICEQYCIYFQQMLQQIVPNDVLYTINIGQLTLYLNYYDIFKLTNFIYQFISTYEMCKLHLFNLQHSSSQSIHSNVDHPVDSEIKEDVFEIEIIDDNNNVSNNTVENTLLTDCFKLSPNNITSFYISKKISNILNHQYAEKVHFDINNTTITIHLTPLINQELIEISSDHFTEIANIISSFNFTHEEYISKLRLLIRQLIFIINERTPDNKIYFIPLKIIEFLILIYTIKLTPSSFINKISIDDKQNPMIFKQTIEYLINYAVKFVLLHHIDLTQLKYNEIIFKHYNNIEYITDDFNSLEIKQLLSKELYLAEIDREHFINHVITKINNITSNKKITTKYNLIFNKPKIIRIDDLINKENIVQSYWLDYQILDSQKQFSNHKIITNEYRQLLQLNNIPDLSKTLLKDINPIITKYCHIINNQIFKELSSCDKVNLISTLHLLIQFIRPYLHQDAPIKTELFILYRAVIPFLYDTFSVSDYYDYFH